MSEDSNHQRNENSGNSKSRNAMRSHFSEMNVVILRGFRIIGHRDWAEEQEMPRLARSPAGLDPG